MYHRSFKRNEQIKQIMVYAIMTMTVFTVATLIMFFVLGFRFNANDGKIEQYAFLQFATSPSGAAVSIDGELLGSKTPNKASVPAGRHQITMWREGYDIWQKTLDLKPGTITWLKYALLIPSSLEVEPVADYSFIYSSVASIDGHVMLIQGKADVPAFELVDFSSDAVKSKEIIVPSSVYSESSKIGVMHNFELLKWDSGGRYITLKHTYGDKFEWLVIDSQDVALTKNITRLFNIDISRIEFSGNSGNNFYALSGGDIRKLDLSAGTITKPLVSNVTSFESYKNTITFVGVSDSDSTKRVAGLYVEGDDNVHVIRTIDDTNTALHIATARYFNENYIVISEGNTVDILSGKYPTGSAEDITTMKQMASFKLEKDVQDLSFSPIGEYIVFQSDSYYVSYDLEYQTLFSSNVECSDEPSQLKWLDENHLWTSCGNNLVIREFDGANSHTINPVISSQDVAFTNDGKYIYSLDKSTTGYQLQRVRMILP